MMDAIFRNVLEISLFSIAVILPLGLCANRLGRRYGVKWRYLLWVVLAVRLVSPVQLSLPEQMQGLRMELPAPTLSAEPMQKQEGIVSEIPAAGTAEIALPEIQWTDGANALPMPEAEFEESNVSLWDIFANRLWVLWAAGVLVFMGGQGWKYASFRRMLKRGSRKVRDAAVLDCFYSLCREMGLEKRPALYFCEGLPSPLCMGLFRQEVYINSEDREPEDMRLILKHELTHCKRRDLWFKALLLLARAMHFFNPFVHWMARLAERDMEYSCDMAVMENCTLEERQTYSMAILRTVREGQQKGAVLTTAFSGGKKELKARFENIFDMSTKKRGVALFMAASLAVCCGTAFVGCQKAQDTVYGGYTEEIVTAMYQLTPILATEKVEGDTVPPVLRLLSLIPMPEGAEYDVSGYTSYTIDDHPYYVRMNVYWEKTKETAYTLDGESYEDSRWKEIHAMLLLALVEDIDQVQFHMIENEKQYSFATSFDRDYMKRYFGEADLRSFAADEETFRAFVQAVNKYFYYDIDRPEEIRKLVDLNDAAAQKRMSLFLDEAGAGIVYGDYTAARVRKLYDAKLEYVGNASGVGKIFGLLPLPDGVTGSEEGMELFTTGAPYGARLYLKAEKDTGILMPIEDGIWIDTRWFDIQAMIFLALVDNADYVEYSLDLWETDASVKKIQTFDREAAKQFFGETDLRDFAENEETFQGFVKALNRYFYEGIDTPEKIVALYMLSDAEAQERMERMLSDETLEEDADAQAQKIDDLFWKITNDNAEAMLSSNPLDYMDCQEYEELIRIGEPTLKYCLMQFAAGKDLDTLKGHIMKFACQDILGQERNAAQTPEEWYFLYAAVDSMYCVPFAYDEAVYTEDLGQYTFHSPAAEQWGILAAGKNERLRAVYDAAAERFHSETGFTGHKTTVFAPVVYGWEEKEDGFSAYLILCYRNFLLIHTQEDGYGFYEGDGASLPVRMDFAYTDSGYTLTNWIEPDNDGGFEESVNEMCSDMPGMAEKLIERAYGGEEELLEQNIVYYMKAHYDGMNIPVFLSSQARPETAEMIRVSRLE